ncbi:MAG: type II toxin-antitoxin system RelB/DinJ family antitoxin [Eubacteriaceae bacterium]|nr:type II toxin-antitoxin system RelB/DinJ family antitoxin [Eubacteriaceae bacterium]
MTTTPTQIRIDSEIKQKANVLFKNLGLDMSGAVNMFLYQCVMRGGLPFAVEMPERELNALGLTADPAVVSENETDEQTLRED